MLCEILSKLSGKDASSWAPFVTCVSSWHPVMCCPVGHEHPTVGRAKCWVIIQCVLEIVLAVVSLTTFRDGGYLGVAASAIALVCVVGVLLRGCRVLSQGSSFSLLVAGNAVAAVLGLCQAGYLVERLVTLECARTRACESHGAPARAGRGYVSPELTRAFGVRHCLS